METKRYVAYDTHALAWRTEYIFMDFVIPLGLPLFRDSINPTIFIIAYISKIRKRIEVSC